MNPLILAVLRSLKMRRGSSCPSAIFLALAAFITHATAIAGASQLLEMATLGGDNSIPQAINNRGHVIGYSYTAGNEQQHAFLWDALQGTRDLGTLGGNYSSARGINDEGYVIGSSATPTGQPHAFLWAAAGGLRDLGTLGGGSSNAHAINHACQVIGSSYLTGNRQEHAFVWDPVRGMQDLGTLGGTYSESRAINNAGQVIGSSATSSNQQQHAFAWDGTNGIRDLGTLGGTYSEPHAINDAGQVIGDAYTSGNAEFHAFIWDPVNLIRDLGTLGGTYSSAQAINSSGCVIGYSYTAGNQEQHAFLWAAGQGMRDLGTLGGTYSCAQAVNDAGQVLGVSYTTGNEAQRAFVWDATTGMQDLGTLGGTFVYPQGINNNGQVIGYGSLAGDQEIHGFVWDPVNHMRDLGGLGGLNSYGFFINDKGDLTGYASTANEQALHGFFASANSDQPPVASAGADQSVNEQQLVILDGTGSSDPDGDNLLCSWLQLSGARVALSNANGAKPSFTAPTVERGGETMTFELTVVANGKSATDSVSITVVNINHTPVADAGDDRTVANGSAVPEGSVVTLHGENSFDIDNDPITHTWTLVGDPDVVMTGATPSFIAPTLGAGGAPEILTLVFELRVDDGYPKDAPAAGYTFDNVIDRVTVEVTNLNNRPTADAGPDVTVDEKSVVTLDGTRSADADGDALSYTWARVGVVGEVLTGATPSFTAPPVPVGGSDLEFELTVDDGYGGSATDRVVVHVQHVNDPPRTDTAVPTVSVLWPPNHKMVRVGITGVGDPHKNIKITVTGVTQDEPTKGLGDGDTAVDAMINPDGTVLLRAERSGCGDGRVYRVSFTASDSGGSASGVVTVSVPKSKKQPAVDSGGVFVSTK